jgi:pilus assembly protein CpaE
MVTQLDLPCLRNAVRITQFMQREGNLKDKLKVIVNRLGLEDTQISMNKALDTLGCTVFASVPNDYGTMVEARNNGVPLLMQAPRAKVTKSVQQLAQLLDSNAGESEDKPDDKKAGRRSIFSFLGSGEK